MAPAAHAETDIDKLVSIRNDRKILCMAKPAEKVTMDHVTC